MDEVVIKAVQKIASSRAKHNFDYETVEYICEAMVELSAAIVKNDFKSLPENSQQKT